MLVNDIDFDLLIKRKSLFLLGNDYDKLDNETKTSIDNQYEDSIVKAITIFRWNFARRTSLLLNQQLLENNKYKYSYDLPNNFLILINVFSDLKEDSFIEDYIIEENKLLCDSNKVFLKYIKRIDTEYFPVYFKEYLNYFFACELCYNLTGDVKLLQVLEQKKQIAYEQALNIDTRQRPPRRQKFNPFNDIRN